MSDTRTDTAHLAWDGRWQSEAGRADWISPEPWVVETATRAFAGGARTALDLGCGVGRHALALAGIGFETTAIDAAPAGIARLEAEAQSRGLSVRTGTGFMTELPYPDAAFDYVLSFNVIYHGDGDIVRRTVAEIDRVLKPGGIYQGTMLSKRNAAFGAGREVAPDTFVSETEDPSDPDKVHPHFFCSARELLALFARYEPLFLMDAEHDKPGSWHWHFAATKG